MGTKPIKHAHGATPQGTHDYFERVALPKAINHPPRDLGRTAWIVSPLGYGCYRVGTTHPDHRKSLVAALHQGVNLIDTSTNYGDGDSERLVGSVLEQAFTEGWLKREEVVVVSKVGYVQGRNLDAARERATAGKPFPDMVEYTDDCWHCIHPEYLEHQLERSRRRLGLECIDAYLLHNPEYFFSAALHSKNRPALTELRTEFYRRITLAFEFLEKAQKAGHIQYYGVSSNTLGKDPAHPETTSLLKFEEIAKSFGTDHHFGVVQLPLNLFESEPVFNRTEFGDDKNALEYAKDHGFGVLVNRPLNAFFNGQLIRLADFPAGVIAHPFKQCISNVQDLEAEFRTQFLPQLDTGGTPQENLFNWGQELAQVPSTHLGVEHWNQIEAQVRWQSKGLLQAITEQTKLAGWEEWKQRYERRLEELLQSCLAVARQTSNQMSLKVSTALAGNLPESYKDAPLSQKAIASLLSTDGVSTVLVGMRKVEYVRDALDALHLEYVPNAENAYKEFHKPG
jgi:uncharacterized protein